MTIGQKVKLLHDTGKEDKYNPKDTIGTVISVTGKYNPIIVEWSNGIRNSYQKKSLKVC